MKFVDDDDDDDDDICRRCHCPICDGLMLTAGTDCIVLTHTSSYRMQ